MGFRHDCTVILTMEISPFIDDKTSTLVMENNYVKYYPDPKSQYGVMVIDTGFGLVIIVTLIIEILHWVKVMTIPKASDINCLKYWYMYKYITCGHATSRVMERHSDRSRWFEVDKWKSFINTTYFQNLTLLAFNTNKKPYLYT